MFERHEHHYHAVTERVTQHVEVTEKRAPTDESVKLLREMEKAARDAITASIRVSDTPVECVIHHREDFANASDQFLIVYSIKGKKRTVKHEHFQRLELSKDERQGDLIKGLTNALATDIASLIMSASLPELLRKVTP